MTGGENLADYLNCSKSQFPHLQSRDGSTQLVDFSEGYRQ